MKQIVTNQTVKIPLGLTVTVKSRLITVKGPRGILKRSFKHLALDIHVLGMLNLVNPHLHRGRVENHLGNHPQYTQQRLNPIFPVISILVYCRSDTLDHAAIEVVNIVYGCKH
uniref:Ribosomal protein L6 n=1 Tax=Timema poppense TaxID=170557 RepID=A0A7R9DKB2_TIMPO|nr:unnamed protein product [Timema poppensis]